MSLTDWTIFGLTLGIIILYGVWKSRHTRTIEGFLLADRKLPWFHVGLSVMATQASAITFLSGPGLGFSDGLRFVQFYFGLPLAMVVLCITFVPAFHKLNVYTAYEFLEKRFDLRTRMFTAFLFLLQRGLSTGITIYAPAIILATILQTDIRLMILLNGMLVIFYTVFGGTKAVSYTQLLQMAVIFSGLFLAGFMVVKLLPDDVGLYEALHIAGKSGRLDAIETGFDLNDRYNIWSGIIGGLFLQLSYFGTDQSQVGRYLTGSSVTQSRLGLIMNGLVKIPMQFSILLIGCLVFVFYQFNPMPLFFNASEVHTVSKSNYGDEYRMLEQEYASAQTQKKAQIQQFIGALKTENAEAVETMRLQMSRTDSLQAGIKDRARSLMTSNRAGADTNDGNYVFLVFITQNLPVGMVGLIVAVIFLAAMGSTAGGLNSLASATSVDFYKRVWKPDASEKATLRFSRLATLGWGMFCIVIAWFASRLGNLIEAVNILGSLFYGTILGIFLTAFYLKKVGGKAVFIAALIAEVFVVASWLLNLMAFLWLNVLGCLLVMLISGLLCVFMTSKMR